MSLSDEARTEFLVASRRAAHAMFDDLKHMREVVSKPEPTPGDIRRLSAPLRRILIDNGGDLRKVAPPRIGKFTIDSPDILPLQRAADKRPYAFLNIGVVELYGYRLNAWAADHNQKLFLPPRPLPYDGTKLVPLSLDGFLHQRILQFRDRWATRSDIIKYVANIASGVHSGNPHANSYVDQMLEQARWATQISKRNGMHQLHFDQTFITTGTAGAPYDPNAIDCVLAQLISSVYYLTTSSDIQRLEKLIETEPYH